MHTFVGHGPGCAYPNSDYNDSCCTDAKPCGQFQGSCDDDDSHCSDGLKCGNDNCVGSSNVDIVFGSHFDCCYPGLSINQKDPNANAEMIFLISFRDNLFELQRY